MSEQNWKPMFRTPASTLTKVFRSRAFLHAREQAASIIESPAELRALAAAVERLDHSYAPLAVVADRVSAAVRFLRAAADRLDGGRATAPGTASEQRLPAAQPAPPAGTATRERLIVASLKYLITPDDLVPDFRPGGYIDDVLLLTWVFGAAGNELAPHMAEGDAWDSAPDPSS